jgi:hypothetical protein
MAFNESQRVKIRSYLGAASIYLQAYPKLENALTAVQSVADGGTRPDSSTEDLILAAIVTIEGIETKIENLYNQLIVLDAEGIKLDATKAIHVLKSEGRRHIARICNAIGTSPLYDYFSPRATTDGTDPYEYR